MIAGGERNSVAKGALLTIAMRWTNRSISIVSTLILARLLVPDDFGVVALAFMTLALVEVFMDFGVNIALVQNADATEEHYHSGWTLRMIQASCVALVLAVSAPWVGDYFSDPRLTPVLWVLSLNVLVGSFENIGIVTFQKNMQFGREFKYLVTNRFVTFIFIVTGAWFLRSYWAMILAGTLGGLFTVAHSYRAHPMRPRWSTARLRELFSVSQWLLLRNIAMYADANLHKLLVGRRTDTATMGSYALASDVAGMPSSELLGPLNRVLFPAFVQARHDLQELRRIFLLAQGVQVMVVAPAGVCVALMAAEIVPLLFGPKWLGAVPFMQVLALAAVLEALMTSPGFVNITLDRFRQVTAVVWSQVLLFVVLALLLQPGSNPERIAELRVMALVVGLALEIGFVLQALPGLRLLDMLAGVWRPLAATGLLVLATWQLQTTLDTSPLGMLALKCALWLALYPSLVWLLWQASGRSEGAEAYLLRKLSTLWRTYRTSAM